MQRAFTIALSLAAVVLSAVLAFRGAPSFGATAATGRPTDAGAIVDSGFAPLDVPLDAGSIAPAEALPPIEAPQGDFRLADGTPVAPLEKGAPRHVRFGVVLVTYAGAEGAPDKGARAKPDALALATKLADEAKGDFRGTVQRGDPGSSDDVGAVVRGVLEPAPEAVLFALPVGGVSGVIDTPRGFWIVKRLE
jgi:hypothetical protein